MENKRVPLPQILAPRDPTLTKDGLLTNCYKEKGPTAERIVQRPGMSLRDTLAGDDCPGQGAFFFAGGPVFIVCDELFIGLDPAPPPPDEPCDPVAWNLVEGSDPNSWLGLAFGQSVFVAVAHGGTGGEDPDHLAMSSEDGFTWTEQETPTGAGVPNEWNAVAFGGGNFVAVSGDGTVSRVMNSNDGLDWDIVNDVTTIATAWLSICFGNNLFLAVGVRNSAKDTMFSADGGNNWTVFDSTIEPGTIWNSVAYGDNTFVAVGQNTAGGSVLVRTADDSAPLVWTGQTNGVPDDDWAGVGFGNGRFVAVSAGGRIMVSDNAGSTWVEKVSPATENWKAVHYADGTWVVVGDAAAPVLLVSLDEGETWETRTIPSPQDWRAIWFAVGQFVAVSSNRNPAFANLLERVMVAIC